jgi:MoaA/NifB/PqqE/SkfB family radical SAM enzyme
MSRLNLKTRVRRTAEHVLHAQAKPVRRLLLATGRDRAPRMPEIVQIESTNICNAKCVFCPRDEMHRRQGIMSMELFRKIVDECAELGITHVRMHNYGEAFIDRKLVEKVIANIERIVRLRRETGRRRPKLILSFVRQNNSADEQAFIEHWSTVADKIHVTDLHNWAGTLNTESDVNYPCYRPWLTFTVLWDGRVSLCCADFDGKTILGDLNTHSIAEIWNAQPYRDVRRQHLESGGPDICRACDLPRKDSPLWITKLA